MPMLGFVQKFRGEFLEVAKHGLPKGSRHDDSTRGLVTGRAS
jgi:hypothetical protein